MHSLYTACLPEDFHTVSVAVPGRRGTLMEWIAGTAERLSSDSVSQDAAKDNENQRESANKDAFSQTIHTKRVAYSGRAAVAGPRRTAWLRLRKGVFPFFSVCSFAGRNQLKIVVGCEGNRTNLLPLCRNTVTRSTKFNKI